MGDLGEAIMERKITIILDDKADGYIPLNVCAHVCLSLGFRMPEDWMGKHPLVTNDEVAFPGIVRYPVIIKKTQQKFLREIIRICRQEKSVRFSCFTEQMFTIVADEDLVSAMQTTKEAEIYYKAIALAGEKQLVDAITKKAVLFK